MTREESWQRLVDLGAVKGDMPNGIWLLPGANLIGADLTGADLRGADFYHADLSNSNLSGAILDEAQIRRVNLSRANLSGASLYRANLTSTDLSEANLVNANMIEANLSTSQLLRANLSGANLDHAALIRSNLMMINLSGAYLGNANLIEANLLNATLSNTFLFDTNLNRADLSGAILTGAMFYGVSTSGWKIEGIKAEYLYLTRNISEKKKHIRYFPDGKFEELYRTLPTIELIFDQGINAVVLLKLNAVIEELKQQNPGLGLNMSRMSIEQDAARVDIQTPNEENIEEACSVIREALKKAEEQGIPVDSIMPQLQQLLPYHDAKDALAPFQNRKLEINIYSNCTMLVNKGDGTYTQAVGQQAIAQSITNKIFHQYAENKDTIDAQFNELKDELRESSNSQKEHLTALTDQLIEELRAGKDAGTAQKIWNEIKEGIKTGGSIASVTSAVMALMKFLG